MGIEAAGIWARTHGRGPETTKRGAWHDPYDGSSGADCLEGRAERYLDPAASGWSWEGFLKNLGMQGGMSAIHGTYEAAKDATRKASPGIGEVGTDIDMVNRPKDLEQQFQALQGRQLAENGGWRVHRHDQ